MHKQNCQGWQNQAANLAISVQVRLPDVLLSYTAGHPRNTLSQDLRTETEMLLKALCHSLLYRASTDMCYEGKNKSAWLNQHLVSMSAPNCEHATLQRKSISNSRGY